jgi:crotonobetainyl-CoA:carnitine CoA-transferase CaiB-like acyl-CoA transferase
LWSYAELFRHPHAEARGLRLTARDPQGRPVSLVGSPFHINTPAGPSAPAAPGCPPGPGEDTEAVLRELCGVGDEELARLHRDGIITGPRRGGQPEEGRSDERAT